MTDLPTPPDVEQRRRLAEAEADRDHFRDLLLNGNQTATELITLVNIQKMLAAAIATGCVIHPEGERSDGGSPERYFLVRGSFLHQAEAEARDVLGMQGGAA